MFVLPRTSQWLSLHYYTPNEAAKKEKLQNMQSLSVPSALSANDAILCAPPLRGRLMTALPDRELRDTVKAYERAFIVSTGTCCFLKKMSTPDMMERGVYGRNRGDGKTVRLSIGIESGLG